MKTSVKVAATRGPIAKTVVKATTKLPSISRTKAIELIKESKGRFLTVVFVEQDGSLRKMNCQYSANSKPSSMGYLLVKDVQIKNGKNYRNVDTRTLKSLKVNGVTYKVK